MIREEKNFEEQFKNCKKKPNKNEFIIQKIIIN